MKLNLKSNALWEREHKSSRKKTRKRKGMIACTVIAVSIIILADIVYREKTGAYYPQIFLPAEAQGKEPEVKISPGHDKILKFPSMPYTLAVKGQVVEEQQDSCLLMPDKEICIRIMQEDSSVDTHESLIRHIWPADGYTTYQEFFPQTGYLNNRETETVCYTIKPKGEKVYCILYRTPLETKDAVLFGYTANKAKLKQLNQELEELFYTLHQITEKQAKAMTQDKADSLTSIDKDGNQQEYYLPSQQEDYGTDGLGVAKAPEEGYNGPKDIPDNVVYRDDMQEDILVDSDTENLYVVFQYTNLQTPLTDIRMESPEKDRLIYPDHSYDGFYTFQVDNAEEGIWKLLFSADSYIGYYYISVFREEEKLKNYMESQAVMYAIPLGDFENGS